MLDNVELGDQFFGALIGGERKQLESLHDGVRKVNL